MTKWISLVVRVLFGGALIASVATPQASGASGPTLGQGLPEALSQRHSGEHGVSIAQAAPGEVERQVPVREEVEPMDSPEADMDRGNAEAQTPAINAPPSSGEGPPPAEQPPDVQQPAVEP